MVRDQRSFVEAFASTKLGRNQRLERTASQVKWYRFEKLLHKLEPEAAGRPPIDPLLMFKALLLQQWYALSDAELEDALNDRVSFRRFVGLGHRIVRGSGRAEKVGPALRPGGQAGALFKRIRIVGI